MKLERLHNIINQKVELISGDKNRFLNMCQKSANDNKYILHDIKELYPQHQELKNTMVEPTKKLKKKA
jgi:glutathionylspermidine synthase